MKTSLVLVGNLKVWIPMLCCFYVKLNTNSLIRNIYYNIIMYAYILNYLYPEIN